MPITPGRDLLVLCYHALSETWPAPLSVLPRRFEQQIQDLLERGYVGATFAGALGDPPARRTLAVTFDDGFRSVFTLAAPVLARLGVPGTLFVPTALIGDGSPLEWRGIDEWRGGEFEPELRGMTWEEVGQLGDAGWEIGSHTRTHPRLTRLSDEVLRDELSLSREELEERLGCPCRSLAYPYGDVDGASWPPPVRRATSTPRP